MTDKEVQDLISLKKYEQPEEGYFDEFLVEFQQRQRSEILKTSARGLFVERVKAWFAEFGAMRWLVGAGAAYAAVSLCVNVLSEGGVDALAVVDDEVTSVVVRDVPVEAAVGSDIEPVGMVFVEPVDFSASAPVFYTDEKIF